VKGSPGVMVIDAQAEEMLEKGNEIIDIVDDTELAFCYQNFSFPLATQAQLCYNLPY
jgi:hypothetical protein